MEVSIGAWPRPSQIFDAAKVTLLSIEDLTYTARVRKVYYVWTGVSCKTYINQKAKPDLLSQISFSIRKSQLAPPARPQPQIHSEQANFITQYKQTVLTVCNNHLDLGGSIIFL